LADEVDERDIEQRVSVWIQKWRYATDREGRVAVEWVGQRQREVFTPPVRWCFWNLARSVDG